MRLSVHTADSGGDLALSTLPDGHDQLPYQHRKLQNKNRGYRGRDGKERLRDPSREDFVYHVRSPLNELIER
jgi:hypothetical protein